ncbi:MAG TPA: hypothetical protein VMU54_08435 [Planctomycetota bacterium]|nr:hypothetical protein [Planctomycetota bacterium]
MAVRRFAALFFFCLGLPLFCRETEDVPLCLRSPDPAEHQVWSPLAVDPDDASADSFFEDEVWAKVGERTCLNCHSAGGDAEESKFLLRDASFDTGLLRANRAAFEKMAAKKLDGRSRLLVKVSGGQNHGGGVTLKPDSTGYRILESFVRRLEGSRSEGRSKDYLPRPFFDGVRMASPERLLRRVTLSLAARLPTDPEQALVAEKGAGALDAILDSILKEPAFYDRLKEGFNDIFLTLGYDGNADDALSYDHFEKTRHWAEKFSLDHIPEKERQKARYKLWDDYRKALKHEPLELIKYIVLNERPFTEIVTADYIMMTPYTSRGYGIFETLKEQFKNVDDPFEYVPAKLPALKGRDGKTQKTAEGTYPSAGILTMFQYLRRYPTTVTNRNRARARMYYRHFLGIDVMALAPRVSDAAAVAKKFSNPTMQAPDCVVCHKTVDPVAGLFQDYFNEEGHFGPRKEGWFTDMFGPGLEGRPLPPEEKWRSLQWLGAETAKDPRFAVAMVEHVYYILLGRKVLQPPLDIDDPQFTPKRRAYLIQRREIQDIARKFTQSRFNLKAVFKALIASPFYRVDGLAEAATHPARRAELDDIGIVRMLTPEQIERKVFAVFGDKWGRLESEEYRILYGGIDSKAVTERMSDPSGAMGAIQRIMSNDVACRNVMRDFSRPAAERRLFPDIEPDVVPGSPEAERKIRQAIVHLHSYVLGQDRAPDHPDIERTFQLFAGILEDAHEKKGVGKEESYFCGARKDPNSDKGQRREDPTYAVRAWRAVVTYLLRQDDFLYE